MTSQALNHNGTTAQRGLGVSDPSAPENVIATKILDSAFKIHKMYGPGLLESVYESLMVYELTANQKLKVEKQKAVPLVHEELVIDAGYRLDILVEDLVILELKCVEKILPVHEAQILSYLKLSKIRLGLLINFHSEMLKSGIKRFVV